MNHTEPNPPDLSPRYSVVVPVFNSSGSIAELFTRIRETFRCMNETWELILVDDGSTDESWKIICDVHKSDPDHCRAVRFSRNFGQHNAVLCGISYARGQQIITLDDDLQQPPEEIPKLVAVFVECGSDLVYGYYKKKKHSLIRNIGSRLIKRSARYFYEAPGEGSSFRLMRRQLALQVLNHAQGFVYIDELLLWYTTDISFAEVKHEKRRSGRSGYSGYKLFKLTLNLILYYTAIPLKIMVFIGFLSSFVSFLLGLYFILRKAFFHVPHGYTSIIVTILFSTGLIVFCLGIIGEYLVRMYMVQNRKPMYSIKQALL